MGRRRLRCAREVRRFFTAIGVILVKSGALSAGVILVAIRARRARCNEQYGSGVAEV